jgi:hypothetical protein
VQVIAGRLEVGGVSLCATLCVSGALGRRMSLGNLQLGCVAVRGRGPTHRILSKSPFMTSVY